MKIGRILLAMVAVLVLHALFMLVTCCGIFSWVYKLQPTNVWKPMYGPPGASFYIGQFIFMLLFVLVYVLLKAGLPGKNVMVKGAVYGLCIWAVGVLPGMAATYALMNIAPGVVLYWTIQALVLLPLKGLAAAAICGN